ncbi:ATP-binding protein [Streptomyces sp. NPDC059850]|uniref:ATP-binding protein n=1 Tax=Streptomyces sp. NPDC059850 TaxID=3346970 RepID=UPI00364C7739
MEQHHRAPHEHGHDDPSPRPADAAAEPQPPRDADVPAGPVRTVRIVTGDHLLTVNPVDGSEIEPCPPGERSARAARPERHTPDQRAELRRAAAAPRPSGTVVPDLPMLERDEERERLARLLARGRSVRVTGPSGAGRSVLLEAVAADCDRLAPDGVVRLSGYHRTPTDLLYDLYAAVYRAPLYRPERAELLEVVQEIGAVVVLDDIEFGGAALDEFLDATPECAFLISATPDVAAPSADSHLEEVFLSGLSRTAGLELLERALRRPLAEDEASWAADLWFESEGLPLRFVQAGALLRQREAAAGDATADAPADASADTAAEGDAEPRDAVPPLPPIPEAAAPAALLAAGLGEAARDALRFAVALGGECPHQAHLPALTDDPHADAALGELLAHGLVTTVGPHYRLAAGVADQLAADGYAGDAAASAGRAHTVAQHYTWWAAHPSVAPERVAVEADAILAAMAALVTGREAGHADAAVDLARAAAPAFAAALHWGAWERAVRHGQESARLAGQVADEAYFHHELGVLALCTGNLDRARAELEASIGLRGALADKRGTVAGRRALALVSDRTGAAMPDAFGPGVVRTRPPAAAAPSPSSSPSPEEQVTAVITPVGETTKIPPVAATAALPTQPAPAPASNPTSTKPRRLGSLRNLALTGTRRNMAAAGAGVLLVAVLGTVVTLGAIGGDNDKPSSDRVKPRESASKQDDDKDLTADEPSDAPSQAPQPGLSNVPLSSPSSVPSSGGTPSGSPTPSDPSTTGDPSQPQTPSAPTTPPTTHEPTHAPTGGPTTGGPTTPPPSPTPTRPTAPPTTATSTSTTASGPPSPGGPATSPSASA